MFAIIGMIICSIVIAVSLMTLVELPEGKLSLLSFLCLLIGIFCMEVIPSHSDTIEKSIKDTTAVIITTDAKDVSTLKELDTGSYIVDADDYYTTMSTAGKRLSYKKNNTKIINNSDGNYVKKITTVIKYDLDNVPKSKRYWVVNKLSESKVTFEIHTTGTLK